MELTTNDMCFACGRKNPIGLKLEFSSAGAEYTGELEVGENYQGWAGILHGGILATALDEVMARLLADKGYHAITVQLEVRFISPVKVGEKIRLRGRILEERKRLIRTEAQALLADGTLAATGKAASLRV